MYLTCICFCFSVVFLTPQLLWNALRWLYYTWTEKGRSNLGKNFVSVSCCLPTTVFVVWRWVDYFDNFYFLLLCFLNVFVNISCPYWEEFQFYFVARLQMLTKYKILLVSPHLFYLFIFLTRVFKKAEKISNSIS